MATPIHSSSNSVRQNLEEDRFRALFNGARDAILIADDDGRYLDANPAACELLGYTKEALLEKRVRDIVAPVETPEYDGYWRRFQAENHLQGEIHLRRSDGTTLLAEFNATTNFLPGCHLSILRDITERRKMEKALQLAHIQLEQRVQERTEFLNALLDHVSDGILACDSIGKVNFMNRASRELYGYPQGVPPSGSPVELFRLYQLDGKTPLQPEEVPLLRALKGDPVHQVEIMVHSPTLGSRRVIVNGTALHDPSGNRIGALVTTRDITPRIHAETERDESRAIVERLHLEQELRERFVAALSHDLRSPLTTTMINAQLIQHATPEASPPFKNAQRIVEAIGRADRMISDLLDASRLSAGQELDLDRSECDLVLQAKNVIEDLQIKHGNRFVLDAQKPVQGIWDNGAIRRILENLVTNGIKYGSPERPVTLRVRQVGNEAMLSVHNEGNPIPPEDFSALFEPFKRISSPRRNFRQGWGLGLAVVKGLVTAHGGRIEVTSSPEAGTEFRIRLPGALPQS